MSAPDRLLTTAECARWLAVSEQTLRNMRTRGGGPPCTKVGRAVRYVASDVEAYLAARREHRTPAPESLRSAS